MRGQSEWGDRSTERKVWNMATWNLAKFPAFLSVFLSPHSDCPLIRSDEALWRNVFFSKKEKNWKSKPGFTMLVGLSAAQKNYSAPVEKLCWSCLSPTLNLFHPPCPLRSKAARIKYGAPAGKTADAAFLRSTLNPFPPSFLVCFFPFSFPFLSLLNLSPPSSFGFFRSFPFSVLLGTLPSSIPSFLYFYLLTPTVLSLDLMKPYGGSVGRTLETKDPSWWCWCMRWSNPRSLPQTVIIDSVWRVLSTTKKAKGKLDPFWEWT